MPKGRIALLFLLTVSGFVAVLLRLFQIQIIQNDEHTARSDNQRQAARMERERGTIYDRRGRELALSLRVRSLAADPRKFFDIAKRRAAAEKLAPILGVGVDGIEERLARQGEFVWLARKLPDEEARKIEALRIPGIFFETEFKRQYPHNQIASHVLGFVGIDDQGLEGVERSLDEYLIGPDVRGAVTHDAFGNPIPVNGRIAFPQFDGYSVELTIDLVIQSALEDALRRQIEAFEARSASAVVIDPATGEILALANYPTYDPNQVSLSDASMRRNRALTDQFEPGSTFKVFVGALALEKKLVRDDETFSCPGFIMVAGHRVRCHKPHGIVTYRDGIAVSCNVAAIEIARRLTPEQIYQLLRDFGFGQPLGVSLGRGRKMPGEIAGTIRPPSQWSGMSTSMLGMGQEAGVTTIQLAAATAALANGGRMMVPRLVRRIYKPSKERNGEADELERTAPEVRRQVLSADAAHRIAEIMENAVSKGTGIQAAVGFFPVAGKTGTAQVASSAGGYADGLYNSVFIGWTPVHDPVMAMAVVVREPDAVKGHYGGAVAAPVFQWVGSEALAYLRIVPSSRIAKTSGERKAVVSARIRDAAGTIRNGQVVVPDLLGLTIREVNEVMNALPVDFRPNGSGIAVSQKPAAGAVVPLDSIVTVSFSPPGGLESLADFTPNT